MTAKGEAYRKDLGNKDYRERWSWVFEKMGNEPKQDKGQEQPKSGVQNGAKFDDTELGV